MTLDGRNGSRGIGVLLRDLVEGSASLARNEVRLAKVEVGEATAKLGRGTMLVAGGAVVVLIGALATISGIVMRVADQWLSADRYWVAALVVVAIAGGLALWMAKHGIALVSPSHLAPNETVTTLKEDVEWVKQQPTSGATSR